MTKKKTPAPAPRRQPRVPRRLAQANRITKTRVGPPRRKEEPPERANRALLKKRKSVAIWRRSRDDDQRAMDWVISAASQHFRQHYAESRGAPPIRKKKVAGTKSRNRACAPKAVNPINLAELEALIPPAHRAKATAEGQSIIWVPPVVGRLECWSGPSTVLRMAPHLDTNWVVVEKPNTTLTENPFVCIDSTCTWLAPVNNSFPVALFPKKGVYVICNVALGDYYVGESNDIQARFVGHSNGTVVWTRPWNGNFVRIAPITPRGGTYKAHERRETLALAAIYGWEHVKGGGVTSKASTPDRARFREFQCGCFFFLCGLSFSNQRCGTLLWIAGRTLVTRRGRVRRYGSRRPREYQSKRLLDG